MQIGSEHPQSGPIHLRPVEPRDLPTLYQNQLDAAANLMAGTKPRSEEVFRTLWEKNLSDPAVVARVVVVNDQVVGGISCFKLEGCDAVGYWLSRAAWGKGVASIALAQFVREVAVRPLHATVLRSNAASIRVLERNGFRLTGYHMGEETDRYTAGEVATFVLE